MKNKASEGKNKPKEESIILHIKKTGKLPTHGNVISKIKEDTNWNGVRKRLHDKYDVWVPPSHSFIKYERGKWLYKIPKKSDTTQQARSTIAEWTWVEGPELKDKDWYKRVRAQKRSIRPSSYSASVLSSKPVEKGKNIIQSSSDSKSSIAKISKEDETGFGTSELAKRVKSRPSKRKTKYAL